MKMKKFLSFFIIFSSLLSSAQAGILSPLLDTYLTLELSKSTNSNGGTNSNFKNKNNFTKDLSELNDLSFGVHLRFTDHLGANLNWTKSNYKNSSLKGVDLSSGNANFKTDQTNLTGLFFLPIITKRVEFFGEAGVANFGSSMKYKTNNESVKHKKNEMVGIYGVGFQVSLLGSDFLRLSVQKYNRKLGLIDTNYTTVRAGYVKSF